MWRCCARAIAFGVNNAETIEEGFAIPVMSQPIPKSEVDAALSGNQVETPKSSLGRKVCLYLTPLISGGALVAVIYFLRLDIFTGWEKSIVDLVMVAVAISFFVSLYMAVDFILRRPDGGESA